MSSRRTPAWTDSHSRELRQILTIDRPLGPLDADVLRDPVLSAALYDPENRVHRAIDTGAPFVVGRKGAGKTAFVHAPMLDPMVDVVRLPKADVYQAVFDLIEKLTERNSTVLVEHSERLWESIVWCAVLWKVASSMQSTPVDSDELVVYDFVMGIGEDKLPRHEEAMIARFVGRVSTAFSTRSGIGGLGELLGSVRANDVEIEEAIDAGRAVLRRRKRQIIVIMDSLERYPANLPVMNYDSPQKLAFEGLFRFLGQHGSRTDRSFGLRFAFPAELWHLLKSASSNHAKDFDRRVVAHWNARELITMAGNRLAAFMYVHEFAEIKQIDFTPARVHLGYPDALRTLMTLLPREITNGIGGPEDTIGYLLRHTQLLPRHLILLNQILGDHFARGAPGEKVRSDTVVRGVHRAEERIKNDILSAYDRVHPFAGEVCAKMIPNLPLVFSTDEARQQYVHTGVKKATGHEFPEAVRALVEVGAVGRVIDGSQSRYVVGEFEYTRPGQLSLGAGERLCLHPLFAETYSSPECSTRVLGSARSRIRPIYPYGADPDLAGDYRDDQTD